MRKIGYLLAFILFVAVGSRSQNVQLHYDFGHSIYDELSTRPKLTSTVEMFTIRWDSDSSTMYSVVVLPLPVGPVR